MDEEIKQKFNETDNFIIKILLLLFLSIILLLVTLIILKIAIQKKIIFRLSQYF
jgi:hypothetical protein